MILFNVIKFKKGKINMAIYHITEKTLEDIKRNKVAIVKPATFEEITKDDEYRKRVANKFDDKVKYIIDEYHNIH